MLNSNSGKLKKFLIVIVAMFIIVIGFLFYLSNKSSVEVMPKILSQEDVIKKQIEELTRLRENSTPITEEVRNKQIEELNKLKTENKEAPLSQELVNKQIEELKKMESGR